MSTREDTEPAPGETAPHDPEPLSAPAGAVPATPPVAPVVVPRWVQLVLLPLAILGAYGLIRAAGPIALLFIVSSLIALLLNPFVTLLRRARFPRGLAVLTVVLSLLLVVGGIGTLLANPIADQVSALQRNVPELVRNANSELADLQDWLDKKGVDIQVKEPGESALQTLGQQLTRGSGDLVAFTRDALTLLVEASIALILIAVVSIYMLLYGERIGQVVRAIVPRGDGSPEDDFPSRIQKAVFGYVRGQLLFSLIMGFSCGLMLYVLGSVGIFEEGRTYALFFGAFYGLAELIPYVGPAIGGLPAGLICLFGPDPIDALWLFIGFVALQQIEGHIVAPQVFGHSLRINPLLVIFALLMGGQLYGFIGAFVALPIAAIIRETAIYFRRHLVLEPWPRVAIAGPAPPTGSPPPAKPLSGAGSGVGATVVPPAAAPCPECGAELAPEATRCTACGTELGAPDDARAAASTAPG
ncbi:MAG TPA: AI-2E family transporter [Solirubrobacteraceae bacterium]|jgi:predicted PurR-regulated permease PerM